MRDEFDYNDIRYDYIDIRPGNVPVKRHRNNLSKLELQEIPQTTVEETTSRIREFKKYKNQNNIFSTNIKVQEIMKEKRKKNLPLSMSRQPPPNAGYIWRRILQ